MKNKIILLLAILIPNVVFAQAYPIRNDTPTQLRDLKSNLNVGRNFAVDQYGRLWVGELTPGVGATDLGKAEDAPAVSGDTGVFVFSVRNDPLTASTNTNGDYQQFSTDALGALWVHDAYPGAPTSTTPSMTTATSVTMLAANTARKYLLVQNDSAANICCSLSGGALTGIVPTSSNICLVLTAGASYTSSGSYVSTSAITCYQTSGGTINTVVVVEG